MVDTGLHSPQLALQMAFSAISSMPTVVSGVIGTTPTLATADAADTTGSGVRRVRILNKHATQFLGLLLQPAGQAVDTSKTIANAIQIAPQATLDVLVKNSLRLVLVADGASTNYNLTVDEK